MEEFVVELSPEEELLRAVIEPLLDSEGYELVRIRLKRAPSKSVLVLFVDKKGQQDAILIEHLEDISRFLSDVLDASFEQGTVLKSNYDLEVSSPGLDRPLTKLSHFKNAISLRIKVRLKDAKTFSSRTLVGAIVEASDEALVMEFDDKPGEKQDISYQDVVEAHVIFDFSKLKKPKRSLG